MERAQPLSPEEHRNQKIASRIQRVKSGAEKVIIGGGALITLGGIGAMTAGEGTIQTIGSVIFLSGLIGIPGAVIIDDLIPARVKKAAGERINTALINAVERRTPC